MKNVTIKKGENYFLDDKFFIVKSGKVLSRDILSNGKVITNEHYFGEGEVIGNFFKFAKDYKLTIPDIGIEILALKDSKLEEFDFSQNQLIENTFFEKIITQLIKKSTIKFLEKLYDTKGYILSILKLYANHEMQVEKREISYENFNISKSQYYSKIAELKKEDYICESGKIWQLNLGKIDEYLEKYESDFI
ncbi:MAG: hypothetical protein ACRC8M_01525 [Cetobacterium sp.]|uniref:hypothetical protein n=1 Tax=Cetobacterium sp. TaxID=2071632 RepID=UPI003F3467CD